MSAPGKPPVPKFSSFKKPVKRPASVETPVPSTKRRRSSSPNHHEEHIKKHESSLHRHRKPHERSERTERRRDGHVESGSSSRAVSLAYQNSRQPSPSESTDLYIVDKKGDVQNVQYQRLHKYAVPQYRRAGYGNVLGLPTRYKIDRESSFEDKLYLVDTRRHPASYFHERALLRRPKRHQLSELRLSSHPQDDSSFDSMVDFVSLRPARRPVHRSTPSPTSEAFDDIRSLEHAQPSIAQPADSDLVYASSGDDPDISASSEAEAQHRQRNTELSRATKADPANLQAWLDLAEYQQHFVRNGASYMSIADLSDLEKRTLADLRLHIYEKASKCIPVHDKFSREHLFHSMFLESCMIWDLEKRLKRLSDAIRELPTSFLLWNMYLDAAQTKSTGFRFEETKAFFLESLQKMQTASPASDTEIADEAEDMHLYVVLRYTAYLREAGYEELSVAVWQALFEYHLFRPVFDTDIDVDIAALRSFEAFWESEVPRFGESGSSGWRHSVSEDVACPPHIAAYEQALHPLHPFGSFARSEQAACDALRFPGRTVEDIATDDPYHIVFFSDIKDLLSATAMRFSHHALIDAFLCYMGLPARPIPTNCTSHNTRVQTWRSDAFVSDGMLKDITRSTSNNTISSTTLPHLQNTTQTLFSGVFPAEPKLEHENPALEAVLSFARAGLSSLVQEYPDDEILAEYYLAFACSYYPKEASKLAKATLKRRPTSLRLYNACAMVESRLDRPEKASHIWAGAIKLKDNLPSQAQENAVLLWQSWIWSEMERGEPRLALSRLVSFDGNLAPDTKTVLSSATLRVTKAFREGFEHAISHRNAYVASLNAECLALLAYLSQPDALTSAIRVLHEHIATVEAGACSRSSDLTTLELLHQAKARTFAYHIKQQRSYRPGFIRSELEESIKRFPNNTMFLSLYAEIEARFRVDDRVRAVLRDDVGVDRRSALVRFSFEIDQEMSRCKNQASGSTIESVRAAFARALLANGSSVRHSKTLWTRWLRFEEQVVQDQTDDSKERSRQKAIQKWKEVFFGGLHHLPWAKEWILTGLECFDCDKSYAWSARELRGLYNLLQERELRVRVEGLEDLLDGDAKQS